MPSGPWLVLYLVCRVRGADCWKNVTDFSSVLLYPCKRVSAILLIHSRMIPPDTLLPLVLLRITSGYCNINTLY